MSTAKLELVKGVVYTALAKYSGIVIQLIVTMFLARILVPEDFGVVAIAVVIINFFSMLSDMGLGPAIIQNKSLTKDDCSNIFSLTFFIGIFLSLTFFVLSDFISALYESEMLSGVIRFFSVAVFFHCIDIVPSSLLKKNKEFKFIAKNNVAVQVICGVVSVFFAYLNFGVYALMIQPIFGSAVLFLIFYRRNVLSLKWRLDFNSLKKIYSYSMYQFLFSFINYFSRNLDKLVVGKTFGVAELGYYEKSYRLMMLPVGNLSHVITPAIQPIFSEYQNDKDWLFAKSVELFRVLTLIGFPLTSFLFFSSRELVLLVFGGQWEGAVPVFQILSLSVGIQIIYSPQGAFFQSANAVKQMFHCGIVTALVNIAAIVIGCFVFHSLTMLAWCVVFAYLIAFFVVYYVMMEKVFCQSFLLFLKILIEPVLLSVAVSAALVTACLHCEYSNVFVSLFVKGLVFALVMIGYEIKFKTFRRKLKR